MKVNVSYNAGSKKELDMPENLSIVKVQEELEKGGTGAELAGAFTRGLANYVPKVGPILVLAEVVSFGGAFQATPQ